MWMWTSVNRAVKINMLTVRFFKKIKPFLILNEMNAALFGWRYIRLYEHAVKHNNTQKRSSFSTDFVNIKYFLIIKKIFKKLIFK